MLTPTPVTPLNSQIKIRTVACGFGLPIWAMMAAIVIASNYVMMTMAVGIGYGVFNLLWRLLVHFPKRTWYHWRARCIFKWDFDFCQKRTTTITTKGFVKSAKTKSTPKEQLTVAVGTVVEVDRNRGLGIVEDIDEFNHYIFKLISTLARKAQQSTLLLTVSKTEFF